MLKLSTWDVWVGFMMVCVSFVKFAMIYVLCCAVCADAMASIGAPAAKPAGAIFLKSRVKCFKYVSMRRQQRQVVADEASRGMPVK